MIFLHQSLKFICMLIRDNLDVIKVFCLMKHIISSFSVSTTESLFKSLSIIQNSLPLLSPTEVGQRDLNSLLYVFIYLKHYLQISF